MKPLTGRVISAKNPQTVVVRVTRVRVHPLYGKRVRRRKRYQVDDQLGVKPGDWVTIQVCRPVSKTKRWRITGVIDKQKKVKKKKAKK
jgi:small subunit ribosomal protein S17